MHGVGPRVEVIGVGLRLNRREMSAKTGQLCIGRRVTSRIIGLQRRRIAVYNHLAARSRTLVLDHGYAGMLLAQAVDPVLFLFLQVGHNTKTRMRSKESLVSKSPMGELMKRWGVPSNARP